MNETIEALLEIQELDRQVEELRSERDLRPQALAREQGAVAAGEAAVAEAERRQKEAQAKVDRLNTVLLTREQQIQKHEQAMLAPKINNKEYKAIQNEIASIRADNAMTEEQVLLAMEEVDELAGGVAAARGDLERHRAALAVAEERVRTEVGAFDRKIQALLDDRQARLDALPGEVVALYERVHSARGSSVVARVSKDHYCEGCNILVTIQDIALVLKGDKLRQCPSCQRILYGKQTDFVTEG